MGEDGSVCVVRQEEQERVEQGKEEQCTQQNVTQCYNSYVTTYRDAVRERCEEVFVKTCRIVLREKAYNATTRVCKRPLVKECVTPVLHFYQMVTDLLFPPAANIWRLWCPQSWVWSP